MHKKLVSKLIRDIVPTSKRHIISRTPSTVKGFTLLEVMVVTTILATLATTTLVALNPTELLAQMRDSQRITTIGMLRDAVSLLVADRPATNLGNTAFVHISLPSIHPDCLDLLPNLPTLPVGQSYRCVTAERLTNIDNTGWIPLDFRGITDGSPFTHLPVDPINTFASFYSYIPSPGGRATLTARIESIRQRTLHPTEIFTTHFTSAVDRPPLGTGQVTVPLGSVGAPSYTFIGDLNTGIFSPLADNIGFSTFGVERMRINDVGNVGIGTLPSASRLTVAGEIHTTTGGIRFPDNTVQVTAGGATGPGGALPGGTLAGQTLRWTGTAWSADSNLFNTGTNVGIGTTAPTARLHVAGTSRFDGVVDMTNHRITNLPPPIAASDAATRAYVDAAGAAISFELSCGWITTGNPPAVGTCSPPACPAGFSAAPVGCMVSAIISPPAAALDGAALNRAYRPSGWWSVTGGSGTWGAGGAAGSCVVVCFR